MKTCVICNKPVPPPTWRIAAKQLAKRKLCGNPSCKSAFSRQTIKRSFKKHGGEITKFRKTNGMHRPEVRAKVSASLKARGWGPTHRGGNGRPIPVDHQSLAEALRWPCEVVVKTHLPRGSGYPPCYKIDIGNAIRKIGIEVDGLSHKSYAKQAQDAKKTVFLRSIGWKILRFTNEEVRADLQKCVRTVLSITSK